jgi:outer membrane protein TolC
VNILKNRKILFLSVILTLFFYLVPTEAYSQEHQLSYFLKAAFHNDPQLAATQRNIKISQLDMKINKAIFRKPVLTGNGFALWAPGSAAWGFDKAITNGGEYDALLNLTYPLLQANDLEAHDMLSSSQSKQAKYNQKYRRHNLEMRVTQAYINIYGDQQHMNYLDNLHKLLQHQVNQWTDLVKNGLLKITDLQQVRLEDSQILIQLKRAKNQMVQDQSTINQICGLPDTTSYAVAYPELTSPVISDSVLNVSHSRFLGTFGIDSLSFKAQQKIQDTRYLPKLNVMMNTGLSSSKLKDAYNHFGFTIGLNLSWRLWDNGQKSLQHQKTKLHLQNVRDQRKYETMRLLQQRNSVLNTFKSVVDQVSEQKQQVHDYRKLLDSYRIEIGKGIRSVTDYITVFRRYLNARNELNNLNVQRLQAINELNYWNW